MDNALANLISLLETQQIQVRNIDFPDRRADAVHQMG
jgi:hypothetical protein